MTITIDVPDDLQARIEAMAKHRGEAIAELSQRVLVEYIKAEERGDARPWSQEARQSWDTAVADIQRNLPAGVTPEQIEAEITAAREEVRAECRRESSHGA
ncbi:MAG: hypothetical protein HY321_12025 [Armatimonadetes bacterium]|nr:hypothetical protein [Armatimonadota bacterium]